MYRCQQCDTVSKPGEGSQLVTIERREKTYPPVEHKGVVYPGGHGWEIAKQIRVCRPCADRLA